MSTRSDISILQPDGTVQTQYIHMDGYPAGVGEVLVRTYPEKEWADDIMKIGHYDSSLPQTRAELKEYTSDPKNEITSQKFNSLEEAIDHFSETETTTQAGQTNEFLSGWQEYHYLMAPNEKGEYTWNVIKPSGIEKLDTEVTTTFDEDGDLVPNQEFAYSANWANRLITPNQKQDEKQANYLAPLTEEEKAQLHADVEKYQEWNNQLIDVKQEKAEKIKPKAKTNQQSKDKQSFDKDKWLKDRTETLNKMTNMLEDVITYTEDPNKTLELLEFTSQFHQYSMRNSMLIQKQRPDAVAVGSFMKFKQLGYKINKGEKGIKILTPVESKTFMRDGKNGPTKTPLSKASATEKVMINSGQLKVNKDVHYKIGTVFDVTQTNMPKEKYPELYPNRHRDYNINDPKQLPKIEAGLKEVAKKMKMPVITYEVGKMPENMNPHNAHGYFDPQTNQIVLNQYNTPTENVSVLAHELGHAQLHSNKGDKKFSYEIREMQAELTSYLYCSKFGIDTKDQTVEYISSWTKNGKKFSEMPIETRAQVLKDVDKASKTLIDTTDKVLEKVSEKVMDKDQSRIDKVSEEQHTEPEAKGQQVEQLTLDDAQTKKTDTNEQAKLYQQYLAQQGLQR